MLSWKGVSLHAVLECKFFSKFVEANQDLYLYLPSTVASSWNLSLSTKHLFSFI